MVTIHMALTKETERYFVKDIHELRKLKAYTHFVELGKTNAGIATYLKSINVTP